jgi:hypothetical protein
LIGVAVAVEDSDTRFQAIACAGCRLFNGLRYNDRRRTFRHCVFYLLAVLSAKIRSFAELCQTLPSFGFASCASGSPIALTRHRRIGSSSQG